MYLLDVPKYDALTVLNGAFHYATDSDGMSNSSIQTVSYIMYVAPLYSNKTGAAICESAKSSDA